jgi:hypothetical protein
MPATDKREFVKITLRLYDDDAKRLEAVAKAMSGPKLAATPTDAAKFVFESGWAVAEKDLGIKSPSPKKAAK